MTDKTTLVVMAAGMGSRFGGLKQIAPLGPKGEIILDYSAYDARRAGFEKIVFIIKKEIEKDFREAAGKRIEKMIDVDYCFQSLDKIPEGFSVPEGRQKPWGTGHAILCAKDAVKTPFAVINADDFYGPKAFRLINEFLRRESGTCMVGYRLGNTLTENGTVSRGVCEIENGYLKDITEHTAIDKNSGLDPETIVSMNMWGFMPDLFDELDARFRDFLMNLSNPLKDEFFIPFVVDDMIKNKGARVKVMSTDDRWYGITYKEDTESVKKAIRKMSSDGLYENM